MNFGNRTITCSIAFTSTILFVLITAITPVASAQAPAAAPKSSIDWQSFLSRHDMIWNSLPSCYNEALHLGNGLLGASIYQDKDGNLGWDIGRSDVTDHRESPNPMVRKPRLPIGTLALVTAGKVQSGTARLDLWNAEATGILRTDRGEIHWRSFVHANDPAIVVQLEPSEGEKNCSWKWEPEVAVNPRKIFRKLPLDALDHNPEPHIEQVGDVSVSIQPLLAGGGYSVAWGEAAPANPSVRTFYISVGNQWTGDAGKAEAIADVEHAKSTNPDTLRQSHRAWWHAYYPESFLSIADTRLESFYWIQMYKMASATRADRPAMDGTGPWLHATPWPGIWWDLNIQIIYWPVCTSNRLEIGESLTRMLDNNRENLILNAPKAFQDDSSAAGIATSYDCRDDVDADPSSGITWAKPGYEILGNLTWTCHDYWLIYRYSMDDAMLRDRLFPLLRRAINLYLHILKPGDDGKLHLPETWSPEYALRSTDTNYELALLRWGCQTLIDSATRLKIDDPLLPKWKDVLANLTPYSIDDTGIMVGHGVPFARSHRHFSHLLMVYPLRLMNPDQPENRPLIEKSLAHWIQMPAGIRGFSCVGAASMYSDLGHGDDAIKYLNILIDQFTERNTMNFEIGNDRKMKDRYGRKREDIPTLETPIAAANCIQELLLQSWNSTIRVFPALPAKWDNASFENLRAEGAFLVSAARKEGKTQFVRITSLAGEPCRVRAGIAGPLEVKADRSIRLTSLDNGTVELDLHKGETATLVPSGTTPDLTISPVPPQPDRSNCFGQP